MAKDLALPELPVERRVVGHDRGSVGKRQRLAHHLANRGGRAHHRVGDAGKRLDIARDRHPRVHQALVPIHDLATANHHHRDLGRPRPVGRRQAGGFEIDDRVALRFHSSPSPRAPRDQQLGAQYRHHRGVETARPFDNYPLWVFNYPIWVAPLVIRTTHPQALPQLDNLHDHSLPAVGQGAIRAQNTSTTSLDSSSPCPRGGRAARCPDASGNSARASGAAPRPARDDLEFLDLLVHRLVDHPLELQVDSAAAVVDIVEVEFELGDGCGPDRPPSRAVKRRISPRARNESPSTTKPARSTAATVSRLGWQPPLIHVQGGWIQSSMHAPNLQRAWTCSSIRSRPPGRISRLGLRSPRSATGTLQYTTEEITQSELSSAKGIDSAEAQSS